MLGYGPPYLRLGNSPNSRAYYPEDDVLRWLAEQPTFRSTLQERQHWKDAGDRIVDPARPAAAASESPLSGKRAAVPRSKSTD